MRHRGHRIPTTWVREQGPHRTGDWAPRHVAIVAQWSRQPVVSRSLSTLITQLSEHGHEIIVVSACESPARLRWPHGLPPDATVYRRPNVGHDFGSWATALRQLPGLTQAERVLMINDSLVGPFRPLTPELEAMTTASADVWGLATSLQSGRHLQTFFLAFQGGCLSEPALRAFWRGVRAHDTKWDTVVHNELGLARLLHAEKFTTQSAYEALPGFANSTIDGWQALLEIGFPFVKRMLVADDSFEHVSFRVTQAEVGMAVRDAFGTELGDWL